MLYQHYMFILAQFICTSERNNIFPESFSFEFLDISIINDIIYLRNKMTFKSDRYTYRITWSEEDKEFVGLCIEFPSLSWVAESQETALKGIRQVVEETIKDMKDSGESPPLPLSSRKFSGKFLVRIPPEIHRKLAIEAEEEGISLNRLVSAKLSR